MAEERNGPRAAGIPPGGVERVGWFSLALGVPQLTRPDRLNHLIGVHDDRVSRRWQRLVGARELAAAGGILGRSRPTGWLWGRVAGDLMDLTLVSRAWKRRSRDPGRLLLAGSALVGILVTDLRAAVELSADSQSTRKEHSMSRGASITVRRPRDEVYRRWREFAQDPRERSRFGGIRILAEDPGRMIRFHAAPGAEGQGGGVARFVEAIGGRGTEIHLELTGETTGGAVSAAVEKLMGTETLQLVRDDLRRFRQLVEVGEVVRSDATPEGHAAEDHLHQRAAQPHENAPA